MINLQNKGKAYNFSAELLRCKKHLPHHFHVKNVWTDEDDLFSVQYLISETVIF